MRLEQHGTKYRGQGQGNDTREHDGHGHGQCELTINTPTGPSERHGNETAVMTSVIAMIAPLISCTTSLVAAYGERCFHAFWRERLDHHNRIINYHANSQHQRKECDEIDRHSKEQHKEERADERYGDRKSRDQRTSEVSQEKKHY